MRREDALWARIGRDGVAQVIREEERSHGVSDVGLARLHPDLSPYAIRNMRRGEHQPTFRNLSAVVQALAKLDWSKARYLSWHRFGDVIRPRFSPRAPYGGLTIAEFTPLRVAA